MVKKKTRQEKYYNFFLKFYKQIDHFEKNVIIAMISFIIIFSFFINILNFIHLYPLSFIIQIIYPMFIILGILFSILITFLILDFIAYIYLILNKKKVKNGSPNSNPR